MESKNNSDRYRDRYKCNSSSLFKKRKSPRDPLIKRISRVINYSWLEKKERNWRNLVFVSSVQRVRCKLIGRRRSILASRVISENIELNELQRRLATLSFSFQGQCRRGRGEKREETWPRFLFVISVWRGQRTQGRWFIPFSELFLRRTTPPRMVFSHFCGKTWKKGRDSGGRSCSNCIMFFFFWFIGLEICGRKGEMVLHFSFKYITHDGLI